MTFHFGQADLTEKEVIKQMTHAENNNKSTKGISDTKNLETIKRNVIESCHIDEPNSSET